MGYKILSKKELCPNQYEITIDAPYVVRNAKAGQFIIFRANENSERVPLTIADVNKETGALTLVFMAVGYSTKQLAALNVGDEIHDIVGPLGQPTHIKKYGTVVCPVFLRVHYPLAIRAGVQSSDSFKSRPLFTVPQYGHFLSFSISNLSFTPPQIFSKVPKVRPTRPARYGSRHARQVLRSRRVS